MSRYAQAYANHTGPGDARPTALQIVQDENLVGKLADKTFLDRHSICVPGIPGDELMRTVTGVSSGLGVEALRALYATGAHVFGAARDLDKAREIVEQIQATTTGDRITLIEMKLDSLASVRKAASDFLSQSKQLNLLINNAGFVNLPALDHQTCLGVIAKALIPQRHDHPRRQDRTVSRPSSARTTSATSLSSTSSNPPS